MTGVGDTETPGDGLLDAQPDVAEPAEPLGARAVHTRDVILGLGQARPPFRPELAGELRRTLEEGLAPVVARMDDGDSLRISKHHLSTVFDCEQRFLADIDAEFEPSIATVRGTVTHAVLARIVIEDPAPNAVDAAEQSVTEMADHESWYGRFLRELGPGDRTTLIAEVANLVSAFLDDWPRIERRWSPRVEPKLRVDLCDRRVTLHGQPDLMLGRVVVGEARVLLVDFKTGWVRAEHREDLRFYALLQTLVRRAPPFRVDTYYPEMGEHVPEDVSEAVLATAVRRVVDGADRIEAVRARRRAPTVSPGSACTFCAARATCEPGRAHLAARRAELADDGLLEDELVSDLD